MSEMRDIPGYEGLYAASRDGHIWAYPRPGRPKGRWKSEHRIRGYHRLWLTKDGVATTWAVHRAIAATWIPNPDNLPAVNHIDGNKSNNAVENLEWVTHSDNHRHAWRTGLRSVTPAMKEHMKRLHSIRIIQCVRGHRYSPENTCIDRKGKRYCRTCKREATRACRAAKKVAAARVAEGVGND